MKKSTRWIVVALLLAGAGFGGMKLVQARKAAAAAAAAPKAEPTLELAASDITSVRSVLLMQGQPISGSLKAANSAMVKAKVAGELQGLKVREGDAVKAGQILATVDATEYQARVNQAQRSADAAKSQTEIAQRSYDNNKALVNQGFISSTALETSSASLDAAKSTHLSALAAVDVARKSLQDTVLRAPISGVVAQRMAQPGERVGVDARILEIVDLSRLELEAQISPAESVDTRVGQIAQLQIEGRAEPVRASVVRINPSTQAGSRSVLVYLGLDSISGLRQGLFAQGTLGTAQAQALAVPLSAVRNDKPAPYVQVIQGDQLVHKTVELGPRGEAAGESMVAVKNLAEATALLRANVGFVQAGTRIKITAAPAAAPTVGASAGAATATAASTSAAIAVPTAQAK